MNKKFYPIIGAGILVVGLVFLALNHKGSGSILQTVQNSIKKEISVGTDICAEFPKEWVQSVIGKPIVQTKPFSMKGTYSCNYFIIRLHYPAFLR